jgi:hypothetical protein
MYTWPFATSGDTSAPPIHAVPGLYAGIQPWMLAVF